MRAVVMLCVLLFCSAAQAERLTVVELFTSQGCSSCPPVDALLAEMARTDPALLPLDMHVTYWDRLGWKDPFSLPEATQRQREVSERMRSDTVYTPQMVVDGWQQAIGSDPGAVRRAVQAARASKRDAVALTVVPNPAGLQVSVGSGAGHGTLVLVGFDPSRTTPVRRGENSGRSLMEVNIVRPIRAIGTWEGRAMEIHAFRPEGERSAVLLQNVDGKVIGVAASP